VAAAGDDDQHAEPATSGDADAQAAADLAAIPKIPYARGLKLSWPEIIRIALTVGTLVLLLTMQGPCSQAVSGFVTGLDIGSGAPPSAPVKLPGVGSGAGSASLVHLPAGMTDEQMKTTIDHARAGSADGDAGRSATP